jgi:LPXTG-motif cell wall-anchored protein
MSSSFHAQRLGLLRTHTYGCGCGCYSCGDMPSYGGGPAQFEDYNENNKMYRQCAEYKKAVDDFKAFRRKVINKYGKYPLATMWLGGDGREDGKAKDKHLRSERKANQRLKSLQQAARDVKFKCEQAVKKVEKGEETISTAEFDTALTPPPAPGSEPAAPVTTVSTDTSTQQSGGGSNTMLYLGIGAIVLVGGGFFFLKKGKKKKKKAAGAPVATAPVPVA